MFHDIPSKILARMAFLEEEDARDRKKVISKLKRLRQIPPESGKFLALTASSAPPGKMIEIGTSAAYSTLWLSLAAKERAQKIDTFEVLIEKYNLALETVKVTETYDYIRVNFGNAMDLLKPFEEVAFCFLDAEKEDYKEFYNLIIPKMVKGGIFLADNVISHYKDVKPMLDIALQDPRVDALIVPIGKGILMCRVT
ncbi:MAG: O-methyltransferase [Promethearchaeota archaeon]|nr:MAG: O-methyltransferase [Candidatus Lokiarchaeota archaeon]